jgi:DegV family protein with EDD domain
MKKIAWITDSTASLSPSYIKKHNIFVVPLQIMFGHETFKEGIDISSEEFYEKLNQTKELPKTSQPAIGEFVELYEKLKKEYEYAIAIHATSMLTGTFQSSVMASEMTKFPITVIDSKIGSAPLKAMIEQGIELEKQNIPFETIIEKLKEMPDKARLLFSPGSLEQLHKGGRVSGTKMLISNLLQIKLLLNFVNGEVEIKEKIRTAKKLKAKMIDLLSERINSCNIKEVTILHGHCFEQAIQWQHELNERFPSVRFTTEMFSAVVGVHTGSGTIGLAWNE